MIILNPIYDVAFKYLMEDTEIAREMLSVIINENIISLKVLAQEQTIDSKEAQLTLVRFDFKAIILTPNGTYKKILIELQKGKQNMEIQRFRKYLGLNYLEQDKLGEDEPLASLPIVSVYILGFSLTIKRPVIHVKRVYLDVLKDETLVNASDDFMEQLTHDSYIIQVPELQPSLQTELDRVLLVFNQQFILTVGKDKDRKKLDIPLDVHDKLVEKMIYRLSLAAKDKEIARKMRDEDEFDESLRQYAAKVNREAEKKIQEMREEIERLKKIIEENENRNKN